MRAGPRAAAWLLAPLSLAGGWIAGVSGPPTVVRGPYLQRVSDTQAIVRWRTDVVAESVVRYGPSPDALVAVASAAAGTEHRVVLAPLAPGTLYHYAVGTGDDILAGGDGEHRFSTAPSPGAVGPHRIWALGDFGNGSAGAAAVRDGLLAATAGAAPDVWITLGDNAYTHGTDAQLQSGLFGVYPTLLRRVAIWPSFGNHDALSADSGTLSGPYYAAFSLPRAGEAGGEPSGTEAWYSFDHGNVHLVALDSTDSDRSANGAMAQWLRRDLAATTADWVIVYFHHAPFSRGSHDSDAEPEMTGMREQIGPILEEHGVDLVLAGHSHGYERSPLLAGHHGASASFDENLHVVAGGDGDPAGDGSYRKLDGPGAGTLYVVAGNGASLAGAGTYGHPALPFVEHQIGSLLLEVWSRRLEGRMIGVAGAVHDRFVLYDGGMLFGDGLESGDLAWWSEN